MRKTLKFYLIISTFISSVGLAGKEEYLGYLEDKKGLRVLLRTLTNKCEITWNKEFDNPHINLKDDASAVWVMRYLDEFLTEKIHNYSSQMNKIPGGGRNPEFVQLEEKRQKTIQKQNKLFESYSDWRLSCNSIFVPSIERDVVIISEGPHNSINSVADPLIDKLDETELRLTIQAVANHYIFDATGFIEQNPNEQKVKENVEHFLKILLQRKDDSFSPKRLHKIERRIKDLRNELACLKDEIPRIDKVLSTAQQERQEKVREFAFQKKYLPIKMVAEHYLRHLMLLDDLFLTQIRKDHATSMNINKSHMPDHVTLDQAMDIYPESVMSITKVGNDRNNTHLMNAIEEGFKLLCGEHKMSFQEASQKLSEVVNKLGPEYKQITQHLSGDHSYFLYFEKLTRIYCQLVNDLEGLVYSQGMACKNGLNGRLLYGTLLTIKERLNQAIKDPSKFAELSAGRNFQDFPGVNDAFNKIIIEENTDERQFLEFCQKREEDKKCVEKLILEKKQEKERLKLEFAKAISLTPAEQNEFISVPSCSSSGKKRYEEYFREFLPKMGNSCRAYNKFEKTDEEILAILFPGLPGGTYPDRNTATKKFAELAANNRPYAKLFNPPEGVESDSVKNSYENYWKEFLPKMGEACRVYNGFDYSDEEILAILFPGLPGGTYPDRDTATKKFAELAANNRPYAKLFNPPSDM